MALLYFILATMCYHMNFSYCHVFMKPMHTYIALEYRFQLHDFILWEQYLLGIVLPRC
jgi:hypothetical protein